MAAREHWAYGHRWHSRLALTSAGRWISRPTDGRRFRILAIVDDFTRESLALIPDTSTR